MDITEAIISEKELEFCETWFYPVALLECLFHDFDNLSDYNEEKLGSLRLYQYPMISYESLIDFDATAKLHGMNRKEKFQLIKNVGSIYCFGARKFGKTMVVELLDLCSSMIIGLIKRIAFASVDLIHVRAVLDQVKSVFQFHPICKNWERRITGAPDYQLEMKNGCKVNSVNFNIGSKSPGKQWFGKHVEKVYIEEASMETEEVAKKRHDALSEFGAVFRVSGMTDFTRHSPPGKMFYAPENQKQVLNLPQFVNPYWDEKEKKDRIEQYGGENSPGYKVYSGGEVVEDGISAVDMERVRRLCYIKDGLGDWNPDIKRFEILKENYAHYRNLIFVERPKNVDRIFVASDIGKHVTEIIVVAEVEDKYDYLYNISLYGLTEPQKENILKYVIESVQANIIAIDCGDGEGRSIYERFALIYPMNNLVYYDGSMKLEVGFEYIEGKKGERILKTEMKDGKKVPVFRKEYMSEHSVAHLLQKLLYEGRLRVPKDFKFDSQFNGVKAKISAGRTIYMCISETGDHLWDTFKVFAIAQFIKKDFNSTPPVKRKRRSVGVMG